MYSLLIPPIISCLKIGWQTSSLIPPLLQNYYPNCSSLAGRSGLKETFRQITPQASRVIHLAMAAGKEFLLANSRTHLPRTQLVPTIKWHPPDTNCLKINFDGSVKDMNAASGFIIRNEFGAPLLAGSRSVGPATVPMAEALALRDALIYAYQHGLSHIQVEGDSKLIIDCIKNVCTTPWSLKAIIRDIRQLAAQCAVTSWNHIFREANFAADAIATYGHNLANMYIWQNVVPPTARTALMYDSIASGCSRGFTI